MTSYWIPEILPTSLRNCRGHNQWRHQEMDTIMLPSSMPPSSMPPIIMPPSIMPPSIMPPLRYLLVLTLREKAVIGWPYESRGIQSSSHDNYYMRQWQKQKWHFLRSRFDYFCSSIIVLSYYQFIYLMIKSKSLDSTALVLHYECYWSPQ